MEKQRSYTEDELVQMYQDGVITLVDFICMHPERWEDEFISFCADTGRSAEEEDALAFLERKDAELEKALEIEMEELGA